MTTPNSPDGQTPNPNPTPPSSGAPDDAPIRNWGDVKKILGETVAGREEVKELRSLIEGLGTKLESIAKPPAPTPPSVPATPPASTPAATGLEAQIQALANVVKGIVDKDDGKARVERRTQITTTVANAAGEQHRDLIRGALATMALDGEVDLHAEATQAEADKALAKLRAKFPAAFATSGTSNPADSVRHGVIPDGTPLHELTKEQLAGMSDEEFHKRRVAAGKSRLAV